MTTKYIFDASLGVFFHHFERNPIVPGAMLLDYLAIRFCAQKGAAVVHFAAIRFLRFLRPGSTARLISVGDKSVEVHADGALCCVLDVDAADVRFMSPVLPSSSTLGRVKVAALRDPAYWFLGEDVRVDVEGRWGVCAIDLHEVERGHAWIRELVRWRPLALIEAAGNLAWALTSLQQGVKQTSSYVLSRINEVCYGLDCDEWLERQSIAVKVRRHGALLVWDAWIADEAATRIVIRGAVSVLETVQ